MFHQCFNSTFKKDSFSFLLGVRHNGQNPQCEANVHWPGQPHRELVGAELGWQKEAQRQKGEDEKIQERVTGGQGESEEGDGAVNYYLTVTYYLTLLVYPGRSHCRGII